MKTARIAKVCHVLRVESRIAMASTGHSSPQVPYARMALPTRVPESPRSSRMGSNVPSAVVVSAMATAMPSMWLMEKSGESRTAMNARMIDTIQVTMPRLPWEPVRFDGLIS